MLSRDLLPHDVRDRYSLGAAMFGPGVVLTGCFAAVAFGLGRWLLGWGAVSALALAVSACAVVLRQRGWHRKTDREVLRGAFPRSTVRWEPLAHGVRVELVPPVPPARLTAELMKLGYRPGAVTTVERRRTTVQVVEAQR